MSRPALFRAVALAASAAGTLFWFYTFWFIAQLPVGDGSGMQWVAQGPLTVIFGACIVPAVVLSRSDRTVMAAAGLGLLSPVPYALPWRQLPCESAS